MDKETEKEFEMVRSEFSSYKTDFTKRLDNFDAKLDDLFDEIRKPTFTTMQIIGFIGLAILYTFYVTNAFVKVEEKGGTLQKEVDKQELKINENNNSTTNKLDKTYEVVADIKTDIAIIKADIAALKDKKVEESNRKRLIEKNKQIVRDFANN
jgi:esterase/lipase